VNRPSLPKPEALAVARSCPEPFSIWEPASGPSRPGQPANVSAAAPACSGPEACQSCGVLYALQVMGSDGVVQEYSLAKDGPEVLNAIRLSLGLLGVVTLYRVAVQVRPCCPTVRVNREHAAVTIKQRSSMQVWDG
jgi:hypothetical protein